MRVYTCVIGALVSLCIATEAEAYKIRFYGFAEQCLDAQLIVIARSLRCNDNDKTVLIQVGEYLLGEGAQKIQASFHRHPHARFRPPDIIEGPRLVFLQQDKDGLRLVGSELQAIWPQTVLDGREYPFARFDGGVDYLADLFRQIRGCADRESPTEVASALLDMFHSSDLFVRLSALQTCEHLYARNPKKYVDAIRLGSAFALETVGHPDGWMRNTSLQFMLSAPRSAALRTLLRVMSGPEPARGVHEAAFMKFSALSAETRWNEQFQPRKRNPDHELRAEAIGDMGKWLDENFSHIFAGDYEMIVQALNSESVAMRTAGRLWLRGATGSDFGFNESRTEMERKIAISKIQQWWQKMKIRD